MCYPPTKTLILCLVTVLLIASRIPNMSTQRLASIYPCPPKNDGWPDFWSISLNQKLLWCCHITSSSKQTTSSLTGLIPPRESRDAFVVMIQNDVSPNHPLAKSGILLWSDDGQPVMPVDHVSHPWQTSVLHEVQSIIQCTFRRYFCPSHHLAYLTAPKLCKL